MLKSLLALDVTKLSTSFFITILSFSTLGFKSCKFLPSETTNIFKSLTSDSVTSNVLFNSLIAPEMYFAVVVKALSSLFCFNPKALEFVAILGAFALLNVSALVAIALFDAIFALLVAISALLVLLNVSALTAIGFTVAISVLFTAIAALFVLLNVSTTAILDLLAAIPAILAVILVLFSLLKVSASKAVVLLAAILITFVAIFVLFVLLKASAASAVAFTAAISAVFVAISAVWPSSNDFWVCFNTNFKSVSAFVYPGLTVGFDSFWDALTTCQLDIWSFVEDVTVPWPWVSIANSIAWFPFVNVVADPSYYYNTWNFRRISFSNFNFYFFT